MAILHLVSEAEAEQVSGGLFWPVPIVDFGGFDISGGITGDNPVVGNFVAGDFNNYPKFNPVYTKPGKPGKH